MHRIILFTIILSICNVTTLKSFSANNNIITFERFTTEQGLSGNRINSMVQDSLGFLWLATDDGLSRFDGLEFKKYLKSLNNKNGLSSNSILDVFVDNVGQLWILTINYLHKYNRSTDNFDRYLLSDQEISYRYENKGKIIQDKQGNIWVGSPIFGLYKFNNNICKRILPELNDISYLFADNNNNIWIGMISGQVGRFNPNTHKFDKFEVPPRLRRTVKSDYTWFIDQQKDNKIRLMLCSGFFILDPKTRVVSPYNFINDKIDTEEVELTSVLMSSNSILLGTRGKGLYYLDKNTGTIINYNTISNNKNSLTNNSITALIKDKFGVIWIATKDGLNKFDSNTKPFRHYLSEPDNPNSLHYNFISSFCESSDGNILIGTYGEGISIFDPEKEIFRAIKNDPENPNTLVNNAVRAIEPGNDNMFWIGTIHGLSCFSPLTNKITNYDLKKKLNKVYANDILSLLNTKDTILWIGTNGNGIFKSTINGRKIYNIVNYSTENHFLNSNKIRHMIELKNGSIALGTFGGGVNIINSGQSLIIKLSAKSKSVDSDYINALCQDMNDNLWVGTWDGLFVINKDYKIIQHFGNHNGLPTSEITGILCDNKGDLWVGGMNGLSHISFPKNGRYEINNYSSYDGLQGSYFTTYSTLKTKSGEMYFGGQNGFNRFMPSEISFGQNIPEVLFVNFQVFNQTVQINEKVKGKILLKQSIVDTKKITLNYKHRSIGFKFAAINTSQTKKIKYAYMLEGIDNNWIYRNYNNRIITYNNLPAGTYKLKVKASNANGDWNNKSSIIKLVVLPPFWLTWYAYLFYGILIAGLILLVRRISIQRTNLKNEAIVEKIKREKDSEINNLKIRFFINISHEIRTPLSLIISPVEKLLNKKHISKDVKNSLLLVNNNSRRLLNLVNQLLDFRKIETGNIHLNVSEYDIVGYVQEIMHVFEIQANERNIDFNFKSNISELNLWFDARNLEKILFNLLSNAFKFTPNGKSVSINIIYEQINQVCKLIVEDEGIGIAPNSIDKLFDRFYQVDANNTSEHTTSGSGIGLSIVKNLVELHSGKIHVDSKLGEYSAFTITLKTGNDHFTDKDYVTITKNSPKFTPTISSPLLQNSKIENEIETQSKPKTSSKKSKQKILIVEDNPEIRFFLKESLLDDYNVLEAPDGLEGLNKTLEVIPDLIISDVMMPEMDGIEFCKKIKSNLLTQHIPVIMLSAKTAIDDALRGLNTGADEYIPKPFNEQLLLAKIKTLIQNRIKLKEKYLQTIKSLNEPNEDKLSEYSDPFVNQVTNYIQDNISDIELSNTKIEEHFKTNKLQLYRKLKAVTGLSVNSLIKRIRINEACSLLKNSEKNISEIAYEVGFSDPLYFSRIFKSEMGLPPNQYRKKIREE